MGSCLCLCLRETFPGNGYLYKKIVFGIDSTKFPQKICLLIQNPFADWQMIKWDYFHAEPEQNRTESSGTE